MFKPAINVMITYTNGESSVRPIGRFSIFQIGTSRSVLPYVRALKLEASQGLTRLVTICIPAALLVFALFSPDVTVIEA